MFKTLDKYILKEIASPFALGLLVYTFVPVFIFIAVPVYLFINIKT